MKLEMGLGGVAILGVQGVSIIPIWLAWGWVPAVIAFLAVAVSHRGLGKNPGETLRISLPRLILRIAVDLGVPIAGIYAAFKIWDPISAVFMILLFVAGIVLSFIEPITQW